MSRTLRVQNPSDGTTSFDYIRIYATSAEASADVSGSTYNYVSALAAIDTTTYVAIDNPGFTDVTYSAGTSSFWYAATYYDTATSTETDLTPAKDRVPGRGSRLARKLRQRLRDPQSKVWIDDELNDIVDKGVNAVYLHLGQQTSNASLQTSANVREYTIPAGFFRVDNIYLGTIGVDYREYQNYYVNGNKIIWGDTPSETGKTITIYGIKRFDNVWDIPLVYEDLMLYFCIAEAFEMLLVDRAKFQQYAELVKDKDIKANEIQSLATNYRGLFRQHLRDKEIPGQPTEMRSF